MLKSKNKIALNHPVTYAKLLLKAELLITAYVKFCPCYYVSFAYITYLVGIIIIKEELFRNTNTIQ